MATLGRTGAAGGGKQDSNAHVSGICQSMAAQQLCHDNWSMAVLSASELDFIASQRGFLIRRFEKIGRTAEKNRIEAADKLTNLDDNPRGITGFCRVGMAQWLGALLPLCSVELPPIIGGSAIRDGKKGGP